MLAHCCAVDWCSNRQCLAQETIAQQGPANAGGHFSAFQTLCMLKISTLLVWELHSIINGSPGFCTTTPQPADASLLILCQ